MDRDDKIPNLRYVVYFSNPIIVPQEVAAFFSGQMASDFINTTPVLPTGTYVIKDAATGKDWAIIPRK